MARELEYMAYVFATKVDALQAISQIEPEMRAISSQYGFALMGKGVVGKTKRGKDRPDATLTTSWGAPIELTDGRFAVFSWRKRFPTTYERIDNVVTPEWTHEDVLHLLPQAEG